jgi:hypothetical protein
MVLPVNRDHQASSSASVGENPIADEWNTVYRIHVLEEQTIDHSINAAQSLVRLFADMAVEAAVLAAVEVDRNLWIITARSHGWCGMAKRVVTSD